MLRPLLFTGKPNKLQNSANLIACNPRSCSKPHTHNKDSIPEQRYYIAAFLCLVTTLLATASGADSTSKLRLLKLRSPMKMLLFLYQ
eukprot:1734136-Amphidinium_carterae.1